MKQSRMVTVLSVVLSLLLLGASSCTVSETGNSNAVATNSNMNAPAANANVAANGGGADTIAAGVTAKEKQLWEHIKNKDHAAFGNMLASDMIYISFDGVYDRAGTIDGIKTFEPTEINLTDWKTVALDQDAAVVIYTANVKGTSGGQPIPPGAVRTSTAWFKRGAEWMAVYHQECLVEEPPANQTAETSKPAPGASAANTNAAGSPTPAGSGAADDPVAREKQLWDALKRKDWDTFAAGLAADQIEVEPTGVYNKAETLAAVKTFDFTKASTSGFKATKLDDKATLVTYMVKAPGPNGKLRDERASTIWVNRDGKWLAVFHHGSPVVQMPPK